MTRRAAPVVLALALLALLAPAPARAEGALWMRDAYSGAELHLRPFSGLFRLDRRAAARLNHFVHRDAPSPRAIHPRTVRLLAHLQRHFGGARIDFYSGVRGDGDPTGGHGYHTLARAIDFRLPGVAARLVFEYCRRQPAAGCGLYPNRDFVHLDARPHSAVWVDLTRGQGSRYVLRVDEWLRAHPNAGAARPGGAP